MKSLVLFTDQQVLEYSTSTPMADLPLSRRSIYVDQPPTHYTLAGTPVLCAGNIPTAHITLADTSATFAIQLTAPMHIDITDSTHLYINGHKATTGQRPFAYGDSIWAGSTHMAIYHSPTGQPYVAITSQHYSCSLNISLDAPKPYPEFPIYKRSPRIIKRQPTEEITLTPPKPKQEAKKGELVRTVLPSIAMMAMTVTMGILMGRGIFVFASAGMMMVTVVFSITRYISDNKDRIQKEIERVAAYENYLLTTRQKIFTLHKAQEDSLAYHNLTPAQIQREILAYSPRLFERSPGDGDFLTLSLGTSTLPTSYSIKQSASEQTDNKNDPMVTDMEDLAAEYQNLQHAQTVIDLKNAHLGLVGEETHIHKQLHSIITQIAFFQSYHDVEIVVLVEDEHWQKFEWIRWLPHGKIKTINITGLISAENQRDQVLGNINQVIKNRKLKQEEDKKDSRFLPHYIFVIDNPKLIINHSIMEYLQTPSTDLGFSLIYTTNQQANLPENIRTVFILDGADTGTLLMDGGVLLNRQVTVPDITGIHFEIMARTLTPIQHSQGVSTQIPESVTFFELYGVKHPEALPVLDLWEKNACHKTLAVPLGLRGKDDIVMLNLHEKAHGPHGLVAGTTGSGKSEIVQSYILSLAVNFHPHEVGFLLIDYKGGGMANLFATLPHLLGTITNLDGSESMRALASIKSELARRQRIFGEHGVNHINGYTKLFKAGEVTLPIPHLFIISDEFAELKKEQPDFMTELVSAARIGRSLGVHLILATQKPTGVVDDQIWSNSKFKLALKVADESDSNEMLKTPDAARITQPGRAYLQVGNNEIYELFQSAYSGASFSQDVVAKGFDSRVYALNHLGQGQLLNDDLSEISPEENSKLTQLDAVVNHIQDLHQALAPTIVEKPWLPPLETKIITPHISTSVDVGTITSLDLHAPIALADIPEQQIQTEYIHNFLEDGNLGIFGASGFGKSTTMMNIALTLASKNSPQLLNYFVLDYGNSALAQLRGLPHTADYLTFDDAEKLEKLIKLFAEALKTRKALFADAGATNFRMYNEVGPEVGSERLPAILLYIDNYDVVRELGDTLEDFIVKMTRDGTGLGIYTIITATRSNAVRYSVSNNFKNKIAMYMFDETDITAVVGRSAYKLKDTRGRAMIKMADTHIAQCYLPTAAEDDIQYAKNINQIITAISDNNTATKAAGVRVVPDTITMADLAPYANPTNRQIILGFNTETTEPTFLDLTIPNQLVVGNALLGKTNVLKIILSQLKGLPTFVVDSPAGDLNFAEAWEGVTYMEMSTQLDHFYDTLKATVEARKTQLETSGLRLREFIQSQPPALIIIDDGENFIHLIKPKSMDFEQLLPKAMELGIVIIATTTPNKLKGYDNLAKMLRDCQGGIVLGAPRDQGIVPIPSSNNYTPVPDIGFAFARGTSHPIKLPLIKEELS